MPEWEELSCDELMIVVRGQVGQITAQTVRLAELMEANEVLAARLAGLEHLLSRNSGNSSSPPSKDDDPGKTPPPDKQRGRGGPKRARGKQRGTPGTHLAWTDDLKQRLDRCDCGDDLAGAHDLGVMGRYQQHQIPQVAVRVIQYDQPRCGAVAGAATPLTTRKVPGPGRSGTALTWPRSLST